MREEKWKGQGEDGGSRQSTKKRTISKEDKQKQEVE